MEKEVTNKDIVELIVKTNKETTNSLTSLIENLAISTAKGFEKVFENLATKSDVLEVKTELEQVKTDLKSFRTETREQFEKNSQEHKEMNASIEAIVGDYHPRIEKLEDEMVMVKTKLGVVS